MKEQKVLFLDRDGTIIREPETDMQVDSLEKLELMPRAVVSLNRIARSGEYKLVMVSNQDGLGTPSFPEDDFNAPQKKLITLLKNEGVGFSEILIDPSLPEENRNTRKPETGLVDHYRTGETDLKNSFVVGDRLTDLQLARNLGCQCVWFASPGPETKKKIQENGLMETCSMVSNDWGEVADFLLRQPERRAEVARTTRETDISCRLNLDGKGKCDIDTGVKFLDHMLDQLGVHSGIDLCLRARGDLEVDAHHTVEDTALVLGRALKEALGNRSGIERYGFLLPMDESLARVAIDLSNRPWLKWRGKFKRSAIGDLDTEMVPHFFKTLSDHAGICIHVSVSGDNDHHKVEAVFKGFARALKQAISREKDSGRIVSSKGVI